MSFRKRNVVIGAPSQAPAQGPATSGSPNPASAVTADASPSSQAQHLKQLPAGTRPSPLDGRLTTSTGTSSLDQLLAGHAGLPLGSSLLFQESGTTDFSGMLLKYYAAEGIIQGHHVHLLGFGDQWRRDLPGLSTGERGKKTAKAAPADDKMKIAWRYEALSNRSAPERDGNKSIANAGQGGVPFCHTFDLAKRLENTAIQGQLFTTVPMAKPGQSPFRQFLTETAARLKNSPPAIIHRIVVPSLLSPAIYPSSACQPQEILQFLHALRALLRQYSDRASALLTMPVTLFPRSNGVTRWMELLSDGVIELVPLGHRLQTGRETTNEEKAQGLLRVHSLPVFHEKGGGLEGSWAREEMSFRLSSTSGLVITPYSLPPVGNEEEEANQQKKGEAKKESLEF